MKTKECPNCAMDVDSKAKTCPVCQHKFQQYSRWQQVVALLLVILFVLAFIFRP